MKCRQRRPEHLELLCLINMTTESLWLLSMCSTMIFLKLNWTDIMNFFQSTRPNWIIVKQLISAYAIRVREHLDSGGSGYLMSFLFNRLGGSEKEMNRLMKSEIEGVYGSL